MIFNAVYNIIKGFKIQLTINFLWIIMEKTVIWALGIMKFGNFPLRGSFAKSTTEE